MRNKLTRRLTLTSVVLATTIFVVNLVMCKQAKKEDEAKRPQDDTDGNKLSNTEALFAKIVLGPFDKLGAMMVDSITRLFERVDVVLTERAKRNYAKQHAKAAEMFWDNQFDAQRLSTHEAYRTCVQTGVISSDVSIGQFGELAIDQIQRLLDKAKTNTMIRSGDFTTETHVGTGHSWLVPSNN